MKNILLILIFVTSFSFSLSDIIKIKARQKDDIVKVKFSLPYLQEILNERVSQLNKFKYVKVSVNGKIVFDATLSPKMYNRNNLFKFTYKYMGRGDIVEVMAVTDKGKIFKKSKKIKRSLGKNKELSTQLLPTNSHNYYTLKPKIWKEQNITKAIELLYGKPIERRDNSFDIKIGRPYDYHPNYTYVSLTIKSKIKFKSFAIFVNEKPSIHRAILTVPQDTLLDYRLKIRMDKFKDVIVVGKGVDGKLYRSDYNYSRFDSSQFKEMCYAGNIDKCFEIAYGYRTGKAYMRRVSDINLSESHRFNELGTRLFEKSCKGNNLEECRRILSNSISSDSTKILMSKEELKKYAEKTCGGKKSSYECKWVSKFLE